MGNNLAVKITADVADLQAKFAVARAETNALATEMNKLARASAGGTIDATGSARLKQLAGDLVAARSKASGYAAEMSKAGYSVSGFAANLEQSHGSISTATREFRALFDELSSGRTRQTPGTVAILLQRVAGLGPAALLAVGGVGALVAGLGYLIVKSVEASRALDQIDIGAKFAGNQIPTTIIKTLADEMSHASNISSSSAREIIAGFTAMHDMSVPQINALSNMVSDFATITGQKATKAGEELAKVFAGKESAEAFAKTIGAVTQAQLNAAMAADKSGDSGQVFAAKMDLLNAAMGRATGTIDRNKSSMFASLSNMMVYIGALNSGLTVQQAQNAVLGDENALRQKQLDLLKNLTGQIRSTAVDPEQALKAGVATAEKENPVSMQIDEANSKISVMTAALTVAQQRGDAIDISKLNAGLEKARESLSALQFGPVLERMRADMESVAATWDGTQAGMLTKQRQVAEQALTQARAGSKEYLAIQQEVSRLTVEIRRDANVRQVQLDEEMATGERAIQNQMNEMLRGSNELHKQLAAEAKKDAESQLDVQRESVMGQIALQRELSQAGQGGSGKGTQSASIAQQIQLAAQELEVWEKFYQDKQALAGVDLAEWNQIQAQRLAKEREIDTQIVKLQADGAKTAQQQWVTSLTPIGNAFGSMISGMLTHQRTFQQSAQQMATTLVTDAVRATTRMATNWAAMELVKTGATRGGETARAAAKAAGDQASSAAGAKTVMGDAAKAFSGVYASVAQIPYVGWILAPAAGAAAFAAVAGMEGLASLDVGTQYVPKDMPAYLHEGEAVVPKPFAQGMRQSGAFGGQPSGGGYHEEHNYHGDVNVSAMDAGSLKKYLGRPGGRDAVVQAGIRAYRRGAR